jgi:hypothetical protein
MRIGILSLEYTALTREYMVIVPPVNAISRGALSTAQDILILFP